MLKNYTFKQIEALLGRSVLFSDGTKEPFVATVTRVRPKAFTITKYRRAVHNNRCKERVHFNDVGVSYPISGEYIITLHETGQPVPTGGA